MSAPEPAPAVAASPTAAPLPAAAERLALAALALAAFSLNLNTNVLGALLPFVQRELALRPGQEALLVAAAAGGSALGALAVGPAVRRHGRRTVLAGGLAVFVVASVGHLFVGDATLFLVLRAVAGLAVGLAYAVASALVAEIVPYHRRGAAMGRFNAGMFLAIPVGMPLSVWLAGQGHWSGIFLVQAVVGALGLWLALRTLPAAIVAEARVPAWVVLGRVPVLAGLVATLLHVGSFFTTVQLASGWLDRTGMLPKEDQMALWVGFGLLAVGGSALFGRVSDAIGKRNFVLVTSAALVLGFAVLARQPATWLFALVGGVTALVASARTGPLQAVVSGLVPPEQLGTLMGLRGFAMQAGVVGFALAAGPLAGELGFAGVLYLAAGCQLGSYLAIRLWVHEPAAKAADKPSPSAAT